ncbi:MAG: copper amine oxidase N-terminal domain-containing protein [Clostridiales bacterium]|nr:copper amine oxidase N-terminal domain-containing protein [Clostridiales bacterium]
MKRKIALLLALAMSATMFPVNAFASSTNSINKTVSVKDEDLVSGVYLKIIPKEEVESGTSIVLTFTNSEVVSSSEIASYQYNTIGQYTKSYDTLMTEYASAGGNSSAAKKIIDQIFSDQIDEAYLPYKLSRSGKTEMQAALFPCPSQYADTGYAGSNFSTKPHYYIPLCVYADGEGDMTVVIDSNESSISGGSTLTFATCTDNGGATTTTVDDVKDFNESLVFNDANGNSIRIKETVSGTFEAGTLTIRVHGGFNFTNVYSADSSDLDPGEKSASGITVSAGTNSPSFTWKVASVDDTKITITFVTFTETTKASSIIIEGIGIEPEDEDDDWGEVTFNFKGIGMTSETITVANRADYGMSLSLNEDATTILSGLSYFVDNDLDEDDFATAEVHIEETIADTWNTKQKMYLCLPEMVKIVDFEIEDSKHLDESLFDLAYLSDEGSTLIIPRLTDDDYVDDDDCTEFDITFYVTIDPAFGDNDITLSVYGAGIEEGLISDKVIAKALTPITISTETTKTNIGYSSIATADVTITENVAGALLDDEDLYIGIDTLWTSGDIGFDDSYIEATATGELAIKAAKTTSGVIKVPVDSQSYTAAGSIEITGIYVGTSRSVPYGDYDLEVYGPAVINNYDEDYDANYKTSTTPLTLTLPDDDYSFIYTQDNTDSYAYASYLSVATATGTLDVVVSVTIGETTCTVDGKTYDMGVAPYIQSATSSTMVPLRFVTLALGVDSDAVASGDTDNTSTVTWDSNTKTATVFYASGSGQKIIQFTADSSAMIVDGTSIPMDNSAVAEITDSRMFVPFRALGTAFGVPVTWDADTRTATYNG